MMRLHCIVYTVSPILVTLDLDAREILYPTKESILISKLDSNTYEDRSYF